MTKKYTPEALLTVEEQAEELDVPRSWIYSRTRQTGPDAIPVIRVGKYRRFRPGEVLKWLERMNKKD